MQSQTDTTRFQPSAALWASAAIIGAMIILQAGRLAGGGASARAADVASRAGDHAVLSFNGGNDDVVVVLDSRSETLYVYHVENQTKVEFLGAQAVAPMFTAARGK
jgi:hypothetical protein